MKKQNLFLSVAIIGLFLISGCGSKIKETVSPVKTSEVQKRPGVSIALLPLADYTAGFSPDDAMRRQIKLESALSHELAKLGVYTPVDEDVIQCLADLGVIKIINTEDRGSGGRFIQRELSQGWSQEMRHEVQKILANARAMEASQGIHTEKIGLDRGALTAIGQRLGADFVLRGRIVEYEVRDEKTFNPFQRGILPFFFDFSSSTVFGVARSETYDLWQDASIGGVLGAAFGSSANHPFTAPGKHVEIKDGGHPRLAQQIVHESGGFENSAGLNAAFWGGAAAGAAYLASKGGKVPEAVVQVALALQDTRTGQVLWANRVEKAVEPVSVWADTRVRTQVDMAVEEAAKALIEDLKAVLPRLSQYASQENDDFFAAKRPLKLPKTPSPDGLKKETVKEEPQHTAPENWGS